MLVRLFLLVSSGLLNITLLVQLRRALRHVQRKRVWAVSAESPFQNHDVGPARQGISTVVFAGDSRAAAWRMPRRDGMRVFNRGIGGETMLQVLYRLERDVLVLRPDVVVVQVGVNDLGRLGLFSSAEKQQVIAHVKRSLLEMTARLNEAGAHVVLTTIFPLGRASWAERVMGSAHTQTAIEAINRYAHTLAGPNTTIFDTALPLCASNRFVKPAYARDHLHLNDAGYAALNTKLGPLLDKLMQEKTE